jgi:hypothetical protein
VFASPVRYELFVDSDANGKSHSVKRTTVACAFPRVGSRMLFLFDYGDEWRFQVEVTGLREAAPDAFYPRVIATAGKAPQQYLDRPHRAAEPASPKRCRLLSCDDYLF